MGSWKTFCLGVQHYTELPLFQRFQHSGPTKAWYWSRFLANTCPSYLKQTCVTDEGHVCQKTSQVIDINNRFMSSLYWKRWIGDQGRISVRCFAKPNQLSMSLELNRERGSWNAFEMTRNLTALEGEGRIWKSSVRVWDWRFKHETLANLQDLFHGAASYCQPQRSTSNISAAFHNRMLTGDSIQYCGIKHSDAFSLVLAVLWDFIYSIVWLILRVP